MYMQVQTWYMYNYTITHSYPRYLSLQRSFRGQRAGRFAPSNLAPIPSSPSTPNDLSLSLTRAEAELLSRQNSQARSRSGASHTAQPKRKSGSSRWRFWERSRRTVSQTRGEASGDNDNILPISLGWEGSPPPSVTESGDVVERERGRGRMEEARGVSRSSTERREGREVRSGSEEGQESSGSRSSDTTLTGSVEGTSEEGEGEGVQEESRQLASG